MLLHPVGALEFQDPVFSMLKMKYVYWVAAGVECCLSLSLIYWVWRGMLDVAMTFLGVFVLLLIMYRIGGRWLGYEGACSCLGTPGKWMLTDPKQVDWIASGILAYIGLGTILYVTCHLLSCRSSKLRLLCLIGWVCLGCQTQAEQFLRIDGHIALRALKPNGDVLTNQIQRFEVSVSPTKWRLKLLYGTDPGYYSELFGAGSNVFHVLYHPDIRDDLPVPGTITPGPYPLHDSYYTTVPWLAYCSHLYFQNEKSQELPLPDRMASSEMDAHFARADVLFMESSLKLPQSVSFVADPVREKLAHKSQFLRTESLSEQQRLSRLPGRKLSPPPGSILGDYRVLASTNLAGMQIPLRFELLRFNFRPARTNEVGTSSGGSPGLIRYPSLEFRGNTLNVSIEEGNLEAAALKQRTSVADYRLFSKKDSVDFVQYHITNGLWKRVIDNSMHDLLTTKVAKAQSLRRRESLKRGGVVGTMLGIILLPLIVYALRHKFRGGPSR